MAKTYVRYVIIAVAVGIVIFLSYLSAAAWGNLISAKDKAMFYLEEPISNQDADRIRQGIEAEWEEVGQKTGQGADGQKTGQGADEQGEDQVEMVPEFCIWGQKDMVMLANQDLERYAQADTILLCGNPELVFEDCRLLDRSDYEGCLVDEGISWELFGSTDVAGEEISYEGKSYTIRGVLPGDRKMFAFQVDGSQSEQEKESILNRITLQKPEGKTVQELQSMWNNSFDISVKLMDLELLQGIGGFCMLLFPLSVCICFLWYLYRQFREQEALIWKIGMAGFAAAFFVCFCFFLKNQIYIPDDYIPTRWSDFSFWTELWEGKREALQLLIKMPKTDLDGGWMTPFVKTVGFGVLSEILAVLLLLICSLYSRRTQDVV